MKKFLSLVLALVMAMSLVTVSAGAKDFTDSEKLSGEQFEEAVNVMSTMGIIDGYADGSFQPQGTLTRGAAAKIIACMMLGKTTAESLGTQAAPFKDVPVGSTFAGYIAYCSEAGIIDGYSDGTFRPGNTLTGFAFLKMLLTALGYDSAIEGFANNANWTVNVASRAIEAGLTVGNEDFVGTQACTREEACLYATNTLKATLVEYQNKGTSVTINGVEVIQGASTPSVVTSVDANRATSIDDQLYVTGATGQAATWTVEFGEKYQTRLAMIEELDEFGRPVHTWTWDREDFGTYIDRDKLVTEYTAKVTGRDLYDLLGRYILNNDQLIVTIDGVSNVRRNANIFDAEDLVKSNTDTVGATGNGVLTQVFRDSVDGIIYVAIINTYVAVATDDFDEKNDTLDVEVYGYDFDGTANSRNIKDTTVDVEDEECVVSDMVADNEDVAVADYVEDDLFLVRIADGQILEVIDPEVLSDSTITAFSLTKNTVTSGGTVYDQADTRLYDLGVLDDIDDYSAPQSLKEMTFNIILDPYGYFIGLERNEDPDQYVFITGYDPYVKNLSSAQADAAGIFVDGTMNDKMVVKVDSDLSDDGWTPNGDPVLNRWYTYTVNSNGVYTLDPVFVATNFNAFDENHNTDDVAQFAWSYINDDKDIDKSHISLPAWADANYAGYYQGNVGTDNNVAKVVYGNSDSVYISVGTKHLENTSNHDEEALIINKVASVTTGVANANLTVDQFTFGADTIDGDVAGIVADRDNASAGVYTLYNDKGYVIAAVVVGDNTASSNYVFAISSNASLETDLGADKDNSWTRDVIRNGELVELVYVGDTIDCIDKNSMRQGLVYKVYYDADGNVIETEQVTNLSADGLLTPSINGVFDNRNGQVIDEIPDAEGNDDAVLLVVDLSTSNAADPNKLHTDGWTLFTTQDQTHGLSIASDATAVLIERVDGDQYDEVTYFNKKDNNVKDAIEALYTDARSDHNAPFIGALYVTLNGGQATSVIIVDYTNQGANGGAPGVVTDELRNGDATLTVTGANLSAQSIRLFSNTGVVAYSFDTTLNSQNVTFDRDVYVDNTLVSTASVTATSNASGLVMDEVDVSRYYGTGSTVRVEVSNVTAGGATAGVIADNGTDDGTTWSASGIIYNTGYAAMNFTVARPDWLTAANLPYTFDVFVNGVPYGTGSGTIASASSSDTASWDNDGQFGAAPIAQNAVVTVENFKFNLTGQNYVVEYVDENNNPLPDSFFQTTPTKQLAAGTGGTLSFQPKTADYSTGSYDWSVAGVTGTAVNGTQNYNSGVTTATLTPGSTLREAVVVTIDTSKLESTYSVATVNDTLGNLFEGCPTEAASLNVTITANRNNVGAGQVIVVTYASTSTTIAATENYGVKATLSDGTTIFWKNNGSAPVITPATKNYTMTGDVVITVTDVEVVAAPSIESVELYDADGNGTWSVGDQVIVTYSEDVHTTAPTLAWSGTTTATVSWSADGKVATYTTATAAVAEDDTLTITAITSNVTGLTTESDMKWVITFGATPYGSLTPDYTAAP